MQVQPWRDIPSGTGLLPPERQLIEQPGIPGPQPRARWSASARWGEGARDRVAIGVRFGLREVAGCARVTREDGGFGAECGDPLVPQQGVP